MYNSYNSGNSYKSYKSYNSYKPYKILMLTTSMDYGGAETHILELSKYLKSNGIEVKIISNSSGGELFGKEAINSGIEHIYAPFHSRNIFNMHKSAKILKAVIKSYKPDIIHAHSRIPAFVASRICKKFKTPLVTTMHGTYKQSLLLKLATNWGDYSLYVSDDIKNYWLKYCKLKVGYMTKTVNGINTGLFNKNTDSDIKREFNIKPEEKIILTVGRLDKNRGSSYPAAKLCEIAENIYSQDRNTRIIIVGNGETFAEIKEKAEKVNNNLGFEYIIMTGERTDVHKFCPVCNVYVGISRSALEALSCAKPVIMYGDFGYIGRFTKDNADKCESTNFTCRGFGYPEDENNVLLNDILFCLNPENTDILESDANFGADMIYNKYSVKKMADDAYSVYQNAVLKYKDYDFVLSGYYGYGNIGDDTLLFTVLSNIMQKKPDIKICLLTNNTKKSQNWLDGYFTNIVTKPRFNFLSARNAVKKSKALVFGGGTLLCDNTSNRSFFYYSSQLRTAQKLGKKTVLYANGIGPIYNKKNLKKAEEIMRGLTLATLRDEDSYNYLINAGTDKNKFYLTTDEAVTVMRNNYLNAYKKDFKEFIKSGYIVISVRKWHGLGMAFFSEFAAAVDIICRENNFIPVYLIMMPKEDKAISEQLSALNGGAYVANVGGNIEKVLAIIRSAEAVVAMRYHALVFAADFGIPMIGVAYDRKVKSFLSDIYGGDGYTVELENFTKDILTEKFENIISNKESVKNKINEKAAELYKKARLNSELFLKAMDFEAIESEGNEYK